MRTGRLLLLIIWVFYSSSVFAEKNTDWNPAKNKFKTTNAVTAGCVPATSSTELALNNVRALIHTGGDMWWDLQGTARYEVPKGSGKTALFAGSIWIGGTDVNGQLKLAAVMFRSGGVDYWPGPLITSGPDRGTTSSDVCLAYDKHYNITRDEVAKFRGWFNADAETRANDYPGYSIPNSILDWPAHGLIADGYDYYLAPFKDADGDGSYDPYSGDYPFYDLDQELPCGTSREQRVPRLFGDQTLWWVYNDRGNVHAETNGDAIGMEVRAQAFAFSTNDELNDMTFYNYGLINRSTYTLVETYFGVWTDADMGYAFDDYVGCDVNRGLGYLYNGDAVDGTGLAQHYGGPTPPPPAVGVDFFEGPYQDADGIDNPTSWMGDQLICDGNILNGNINGLNFNDGIIDNERWGMRRFIYFNNDQSPQGNPGEAYQYYNYLKGYWRDGSQMFYDGTGHFSDNSTTEMPTDFMFPGDSDPCGWGQGGQTQSEWDEFTENNPAADRRFVQSAGPFTLEPGAVNDITVGIVFARAQAGEAFASVEEVKLADDKAQLLFDNCFKVVNGPDSPELDPIELDRQVVFHIFNLPQSNNYMEAYVEEDFTITNVDIDNDNVIDNVNKNYVFEGYQVFQLKNSEVSVSDLGNVDLMREVFQCDVKNGVKQIVNYEWSKDLKANVPAEMVNGADSGIQHAFTIIEDAFATGDKRLVNHKRYYFMILSYGFNNFKKYDQNDPAYLDGQKQPYKAGRKAAVGSIKVYEVIPHIPEPGEGGTKVNAQYGDGIELTQTEGFGAGANFIELAPQTLEEIMAGAPWKSDARTYLKGKAPIKMKVVDPLNIPEGKFKMSFHPDSCLYNEVPNGFWDWRIKNGKWYIVQTEGESLIDTVWSDNAISVFNEQIIPELGISILVEQKDFLLNQPSPDKDNPVNANLDYSISMPDLSNPWFTFLSDGEDFDSFNWIRSGTQEDAENAEFNDYPVGGDLWDKEEIFETFANGTWAPFKLASRAADGPASGDASGINWYQYRLPNVDIVLTADKSKWTRSCILETSENDSIDTDGDNLYDAVGPGLFVQGEAKKFQLRDSYSVDKNGQFSTTDQPSNNPDDPNYIAGKGMGWFPGYAIDIETGRRLNVVFGESSELPGENGRDMKFNPTSNYTTAFGETLFGGKHFLYIVGNNMFLKANHVDTAIYMPAYDGCKRFYDLLNSSLDMPVSTIQPAYAMKNICWTSIPMTTRRTLHNSFDDLLGQGDIKMSIRIETPIRIGYYDFEADNAENQNFPTYIFDTYSIKTEKDNLETAKNSLDLINAVPNPYYGYSEYEFAQLDNIVKITNLPQTCTISIYNSNGTLVRRFAKDSGLSYQEWDLKNQYGIPIASGVYIIHVNVPGVGEKIVKWFGALRPVDLNAY